jgi:hypothetical protein
MKLSLDCMTFHAAINFLIFVYMEYEQRFILFARDIVGKNGGTGKTEKEQKR